MKGELQQGEDEDERDKGGDDEDVDEVFQEICVSFFTKSVLQFSVGAALNKVKVEGVVVDASFLTLDASTTHGPNGERIDEMTVAEMDRSLLCR